MSCRVAGVFSFRHGSALCVASHCDSHTASGARAERPVRACYKCKEKQSLFASRHTRHDQGLGRVRIFQNLIQNLPARAARENLEKFACTAVITDSESHPASTHPPASPCSHWTRAGGLLSLAMSCLSDLLNQRPLAALPHRTRPRAGIVLARDELPPGPTPSLALPPTARARAAHQKETGGADQNLPQNLPGWIKICLTKICLRYIQNPGQRQPSTPLASPL